MKLSIVVPLYNEEENLVALSGAIEDSIKDYNYELIFVDDGSRDKSKDIILKLQKSNARIKLIQFYKNFGQTAAMDAGAKAAIGDVIIFMDADMQNDPRDIPKLLAKLEEGYDIVAGWRYKRRDPLMKKFVSKIANWIRRNIIGEKIHDSGCTLKAFRRECFDNVDLYGEMHRYIPAYMRTMGFSVVEVRVRHHNRMHGRTKYSSKRIVKGFLDLIMVYYWTKFASRPMHFFGIIGLANFTLGFLIGLYLLMLKFLYGQVLADRPLLLLVVLLIIIGVQFIIFGIITEILTRIYYKVHNITPYKIKKIK